MKAKARLLFYLLAVPALFYSQAGLEEKSISEVGKIKNICVVIEKTHDLAANASKTVLRIEYAPKWLKVSDSKTEFSSVEDVNELVKSLRDLITTIFNSPRKTPSEINLKCKSGIEAGGFYVNKKSTGFKPAQSGGSKTEKFYVTTTTKMYEGKTVYEDAKGTFVWRTANADAAAPPSETEAPGKWMAYFQVEKFVPSSKDILTQEEFKALVELIDQAKTKM